MRAPARLARLLCRRLILLAAYGAVFASACVVGMVVHLDLPQSRRVVNAALTGAFKGEIRIQRIDRLGLGTAMGVDASVFDPAGTRVILVHDAQAVAIDKLCNSWIA